MKFTKQEHADLHVPGRQLSVAIGNKKVTIAITIIQV
jgi:hypothetical protein